MQTCGKSAHRKNRWNCTNGQADEDVPAEMYSDCSTQATTSAELVRISRFPDLAAVGSSWVGLPGGRGLEGDCIARGSSKDGFRGRQLSPVFCIAVGVNLSNICSYVFGNPKESKTFSSFFFDES